ncbi:hypothetical protein FGO68_gene604 [Halteria grandinella]|uniref:Uncharacterized protein n=1 Tax=Halteria grandinella TaxID=5974 RepID=A0A8J8NNQ5_HALGN|nr:hypothetical protein FGO68_gene604 [Halteria grandinella]
MNGISKYQQQTIFYNQLIPIMQQDQPLSYECDLTEPLNHILCSSTIAFDQYENQFPNSVFPGFSEAAYRYNFFSLNTYYPPFEYEPVELAEEYYGLTNQQMSKNFQAEANALGQEGQEVPSPQLYTPQEIENPEDVEKIEEIQVFFGRENQILINSGSNKIIEIQMASNNNTETTQTRQRTNQPDQYSINSTCNGLHIAQVTLIPRDFPLESQISSPFAHQNLPQIENRQREQANEQENEIARRPISFTQNNLFLIGLIDKALQSLASSYIRSLNHIVFKKFKQYSTIEIFDFHYPGGTKALQPFDLVFINKVNQIFRDATNSNVQALMNNFTRNQLEELMHNKQNRRILSKFSRFLLKMPYNLTYKRGVRKYSEEQYYQHIRGLMRLANLYKHLEIIGK